MSRPVILVSTDLLDAGDDRGAYTRLFVSYQEQLAQSGADVLLASPYSDPEFLFEVSQGWMITGGDDIPGEVFGEDTHSKSMPMHSKRLQMEQELWSLFSESSKPVLGICFGCQFLNVVNGGTLYQHLPDVVGHERHKLGTMCITVREDSKLAQLGLIGSFEVAVAHHQGVNRVADHWQVAAYDSDGIVQAIEENSQRWRYGIQWHPERMPESQQTRQIFDAFVAASNRH